MSSFSLLDIGVQLKGERATNGRRAICTPPPSKVFITNDSKRAGTSENRSSFSLLYIGVQLKWEGG